MALKDILQSPDRELTDKQKLTLRENSLDPLIDAGVIPEALVGTICDDLDREKLPVRGNLIGGGVFTLVFKPDTVELTAIRIGNADLPANSKIVLKPLETKSYSYVDSNGDNAELLVHRVIYAPDIAPTDNPHEQMEKKVLPQDIFNTLRVLRAEHNGQNNEGETLDTHLSDCRTLKQLTGHFVYLRGMDGKLLRYPECEDKTFSGRPIAFIRDLNSLPAIRPKEDGMGRIENALELLEKTNADLTPAPEECVKACEQQNAVRNLAQTELMVLQKDDNDARRTAALRFMDTDTKIRNARKIASDYLVNTKLRNPQLGGIQEPPRSLLETLKQELKHLKENPDADRVVDIIAQNHGHEPVEPEEAPDAKKNKQLWNILNALDLLVGADATLDPERVRYTIVPLLKNAPEFITQQMMPEYEQRTVAIRNDMQHIDDVTRSITAKRYPKLDPSAAEFTPHERFFTRDLLRYSSERSSVMELALGQLVTALNAINDAFDGKYRGTATMSA